MDSSNNFYSEIGEGVFNVLDNLADWVVSPLKLPGASAIPTCIANCGDHPGERVPPGGRGIDFDMSARGIKFGAPLGDHGARIEVGAHRGGGFDIGIRFPF